jgi:dTDP-4-dehydrorhamnose 3,5-epimerase
MVRRTALEGVVVAEPNVHGDARGFLLESFSARRFRNAGVDYPWVQDTYSRSVRGTLRGLHYQSGPPQAKLVWVSRGKICDVAVDLREGSSTFGDWHAEVLDDETHRQICLPPGFAHGFVVLSVVADVHYKFSQYYSPDGQRGVVWSDPDIGIEWPVDQPLLSERDEQLPLLREVNPQDLPTHLSHPEADSEGTEV